MNITLRLLSIVAILALLFTTNPPITAENSVRPEVRALWVDAFRDGFKTPEQVDRLLYDAKHANINTLIVQVRRRGDSYYNNSLEPRTEDPDLTPGFDALQDLIDKARTLNIEIHAWLNTLVAWNNSIPPRDPNHVWNLHGPKAEGRADWVSYYRAYNNNDNSWLTELKQSFYLDPGHPDVVDYTTDVYLHVVKHYDVDGVHLDYSRYADRSWGYNPTSVARYNSQYGTTGLPDPADPQWSQWRREQTANLVRKIYLKAIAIKPNIKVSSAVITWGDGPATEDDWINSRAYTQVYQDWRSWLQEGIIDMVMPMNYFPEWKSTHRLWYNRWIEWEKDYQYGRHIVIGPGLLSQYIEDSLEQIRRAQSPSVQGNYAAGICLFSYGASHLYSCDDYKESGSVKSFPRQPYSYMPETNRWLYPLLAKEGGYTDPLLKKFIKTKPVFPSPARIPDMPWKSTPATGSLMGTVVDSMGIPTDNAKVIITSFLEAAQSSSETFMRTAYTDGSGWFGLTNLPPGFYQVSVDKEDLTVTKNRLVIIKAGQVEETHLKGAQEDTQ